MGRLIVTAIAVGLCASLALSANAAALDQRLTASDGEANDNLGLSVDVAGNTAVVGAPFFGAGDTGAVYVFERLGDSWAQTGKLTASDAGVQDLFGFSVAIDGGTIVVGAPFDNVDANLDRGSVYTFAASGLPERTETAKLTASDGGASDGLGASVAIDGETIVAAALFDAADRGSVYTFATSGPPVRTETAKLTASDGADEDGLGGSVGIDGETIVAGAPGDNVGANTNQGSAYTFATTGAAARTETAKLTASDGAAQDQMGTSVAIDAETIVSGAPLDNGASTAEGSAYTFATTGAAARTETAKLTASGANGDANDALGISVAINGPTIVAGASSDDVLVGPDLNLDQGSAYTFDSGGAPARTETARLTAPAGAAEDGLGSRVAIDGSTVVAGAPLDNVGTNVDQGSASVFFPPTPVSPASPAGPTGQRAAALKKCKKKKSKKARKKCKRKARRLPV